MAPQAAPGRTLDVRSYFDPVECRSLKYVKHELAGLAPRQTLEVLGNEFQSREIRAWSSKFRHQVLDERREGDLVRLIIEKAA